jgi:ribosomal protein S18 acetylase RimI-like enzyme
MADIRFELYNKTHAETVARMWTESREGWPPGFLGASEFTPESIEMEEKSSGKLFTVLALQDDRTVGYCRTTPYGGEPDAAYVALLNVVPDLHGRKLGKKLLLDAVKRTADDGYYRIDLHTWPANLKAMPLYKKTGFFWVPDSMVYMQNYMPFLLGRQEFRQFLGDRDWYDCFVRELEVEPDEQRTENGREIFSYLFRIEDRAFRAEFDRRGRILSSLEIPGRFVSMKREGEKFYFGQPLRVRIEGDRLPDKLTIESHTDLSTPSEVSRSEAKKGFNVVPEPVEVPVPDRDRSPRVSALIPGDHTLEIGIGINAEEPVSINSSLVRRLSPGQKELALDIKRLAETKSFRLEAKINEKLFTDETYSLNESVFQRVTLALPDLEAGFNILSIKLFQGEHAGAEEKIILISGPFTSPPRAVITRRNAVIVSGDISLSVSKMGAFGLLQIPDNDDNQKTAAFIGISTGPPYWNSDLPHQLYDITIRENVVTASSIWPSRPGLKHELKYRLDPSGFAEVVSCVFNGSSSDQRVQFVGRWGGGYPFVAGSRIIPLKKGIFTCEEVYNQIPDVTEDYSKSASWLSAPWLAQSNGKHSLMAWFPSWDRLHYDKPQTEEMIVRPGEMACSPAFRILYSRGDIDALLSDSRILGWNTGPSYNRTGFMDHNLQPVIANDFDITLSHNLMGKRNASIAINRSKVAEGSIADGTSISGQTVKTGSLDVSLSIAGRDSVYPVRAVSSSARAAEILEKDGILSIDNGRMKAFVDPSEFGHVYSLEVDGTEYLMSSHPGPSDFAWEKPWYGGIHPRILNDRKNPFKLDSIDCDLKEYETVSAGLLEKGWELIWRINHKKFGSLGLEWRVSMLPEVPLLKTCFTARALSGAYIGREMDVRGFLSPGGEFGNAVLTAQSKPLLSQGRKHAGAWFDVGRWGRVETPGKGFVEAHSKSDGVFFSEDYAEKGCHLCIENVLNRERIIETFWIFGNNIDDDALAHIFRRHSLSGQE